MAARRPALTPFHDELRRPGWQRLPDNPSVEVKLLQRDDVHDLLARSKPRRAKERAIRRQQRRGLAQALNKLLVRVTQGRLKQRDKILEAVGRLKERFPKAPGFVTITVRVRPVSLRGCPKRGLTPCPASYIFPRLPRKHWRNQSSSAS